MIIEKSLISKTAEPIETAEIVEIVKIVEIIVLKL